MTDKEININNQFISPLYSVEDSPDNDYESAPIIQEVSTPDGIVFKENDSNQYKSNSEDNSQGKSSQKVYKPNVVRISKSDLSSKKLYLSLMLFVIIFDIIAQISFKHFSILITINDSDDLILILLLFLSACKCCENNNMNNKNRNRILYNIILVFSLLLLLGGLPLKIIGAIYFMNFLKTRTNNTILPFIFLLINIIFLGLRTFSFIKILSNYNYWKKRRN